MYDYNFSESVEFSKHKEIGSQKEYKNYYDWESNVLKKYHDVNEKTFFINFKAYLKRRCESCEHSHSALVSLWLPLFTLIISLTLAIPSAFTGLMQYQDGLQSDIDNTYIDNMTRNDANEVEIINSQVEKLQSRVNQCGKGVDYVMLVMTVVYVSIIAAGIIFFLRISNGLQKISFYKDYISVIDKAIIEISKQESIQ